jgi:hypothetical protein
MWLSCFFTERSRAGKYKLRKASSEVMFMVGQKSFPEILVRTTALQTQARRYH